MKQIYLLPLLLAGCTMNNSQIIQPLDDIESIALCQSTEQAANYEKKITAEHGFKRFAHHTYRPLLKQRLFGHRVRVITLDPNKNTLYVAGDPLEFQHHFSTVLQNIVCANSTCQATINEQQTLYIHKPLTKKAKKTTVIECTKAVIR